MRLDEALTHQAETRPHHPAMSDTAGVACTYAELDCAVDELAQQLRDAGVRTGDRVMLMLENCIAAIVTIFACSRISACVIPTNARQTANELQRVADHATPAVILATAVVSPDAKAHAIRLDSKTISGSYGTLELKVCQSNPDPVLKDVAVILYTTGTTGTPKGVMLTHSNALFGGRVSSQARKLRSSDIIYGVLPVSHVFGLTSILVAATLTGAFIRFVPRFDPAALFKELQNNTTVLAAVPQMLAKLMHYTESNGLTKLPDNKLRFLSAGASPLDQDWKQRAEAFFDLPLQNGYGMTETSAGICLTMHTKKNDDVSVGRPLPGVEVQIDTSPSGTDKDVGEILVRGGNVMKGYFRNAEATALALTKDGWLRTGDLGWFDRDDNLHIRGRSKELIIHGGFNVYPPEVEAAINEHPKVIQSAVIGKQHGGDELVYAFIEVSADDIPDEDALRTYINKSLAPYKRPSSLIFTDKLPATVTGKILKHKLFSDVAPLRR